MTLSLNGAIVRDERGVYWLLEVATDLDIAWQAIVHADASGSVGARLTEGEYGKAPEREAIVRRLVKLEYTPQGVYGVPVDSVNWNHPILRS